MTVQQLKKMEETERQLGELSVEFGSFKEYVTLQLNDISEKLKPRFTRSQEISILLSFLSMYAFVILYVTNIKSDTRNNTTEIEHFKRSVRVNNAQYDNILNVLSTIKTDVEVLKEKTKDK